MRRHPRRVASLVLGALTLACDAAPEPAPGPPPFRVLLVGDSITEGAVSAPEGPPWATLVAEGLGPAFEIVNLACGGTSSLDWTRSRGIPICGGDSTLPNLYEKRVRPALPADVVVVLLGTNDSMGYREPRRVPPEGYEAALREIATDLLADGAARVMLLGPPVTFRKTPVIMRVVRYGDALRRVCGDLDRVICGPDVRYLLQPEDDFAPGNVHPNATGHAKIADAVTETLLTLRASSQETGRGDPASSNAAASSTPSG